MNLWNFYSFLFVEIRDPSNRTGEANLCEPFLKANALQLSVSLTNKHWFISIFYE